ncbi:tetraspanin-13 [Tetranychus urticae]|uniref:Tetraspanin n=1 Tax=Tetranychus urticae TaxID=32264 RepID=T1JT68_TETUR|nr:tetraspanin-13 [Tetranychus urticae]
MCGGFTFTKNALTTLNILYTLVSCMLIAVATYARYSSIVSNLEIVQVFIGCGVFLAILSLMGLVGAAKHHQVILFFYMVILFLLFVVQFCIAIACLAVSDSQKVEIATNGWNSSSDSTRNEAQTWFNCCGFDSSPLVDQCIGVASCCKVKEDCHCETCKYKIVSAISSGLDVCGSLGIFFSFTEFLGVWLTIRYRNQKNPRADPSAFL